MTTIQVIPTLIITKSHATEINRLLDYGLVQGLGKQVPGEMCVEACVCFALGLPHNDNPPCVGKAVRRLKIRLQDSYFPSNKDRANCMRRLAIAQLGSDKISQLDFAKRVISLTQQYNNKYAAADAYAANAAANAAAADAAAYADAVAAAVAYAAAAAAAYAAADAAYAAADANAAANAARLKVLNTFAESVVQVLIDMKSPGCEWLDVCVPN